MPSQKPLMATSSAAASAAVQSALRTLEVGGSGIAAIATALQGPLGAAFAAAVELIREANGRAIVTGLGKSGHIARKIAATFASTGTPAFFVHAAEAIHGDLGMVTAQDVFIAISYSGEAGELLEIMPLIKRMGTHLIAITGNPHSGLAQLADVHLN